MDWQLSTWWWIVAGVLLALELVTGTVYLLMLALGVGAAALAAHMGLGVVVQISVAAVLACVSTLVLHRRKRRQRGVPAAANPDVNLDVGECVHVSAWAEDGTARVFYRGTHWTAVPRPGLVLRSAGTYKVVELHGNRLVVDGNL